MTANFAAPILPGRIELDSGWQRIPGEVKSMVRRLHGRVESRMEIRLIARGWGTRGLAQGA